MLQNAPTNNNHSFAGYMRAADSLTPPTLPRYKSRHLHISKLLKAGRLAASASCLSSQYCRIVVSLLSTKGVSDRVKLRSERSATPVRRNLFKLGSFWNTVGIRLVPSARRKGERWYLDNFTR